MSNTRQSIANHCLILLALFYVIMLGGGNYEHLNVTPVVASAPPKSLAMLQGEYRFSPLKFWGIFRPISIVLFIAAIALNWNASAARRKLLLFAFAIDILVTIATYTYFAPETGKIISAPFSNTVDDDLKAILQRWAFLNNFRLGAIYLGAWLILLALNKPLFDKGSVHKR